MQTRIPGDCIRALPRPVPPDKVAVMVGIENSRLFAALPAEERRRLRQDSQERHYASGQVIFREGDPGDGLYLLKTGAVEISGLLSGTRRQILSRLGPGEVFGEMAVIEDAPRSATALALEPSVVDFIPRPALLGAVERSPALALSLLREISARLRDFDRQYLREVLQAERLAIVGRFARSIIHDLKNPLAIIGLAAEMVNLPNASLEARQRAVGNIRAQIERISDMIGEIIEFTQGAQPALVLAATDYVQFAREVLEELRPDAELKRVSLQFDATPAAVPIRLHPKRLRRVFHNLVHNATDAMQGGGVIRVRLQLKPTEVVTEVEDTGPGIPPAILGQLFEPFVTHGKAEGTGLGLSICRRVIEEHGGWIAARNLPDRGAVFSFGLPRPQPEAGR
jgi:signal transduction histidine kinase